MNLSEGTVRQITSIVFFVLALFLLLLLCQSSFLQHVLGLTSLDLRLTLGIHGSINLVLQPVAVLASVENRQQLPLHVPYQCGWHIPAIATVTLMVCRKCKMAIILYCIDNTESVNIVQAWLQPGRQDGALT